jgi:predicted MFS family arabinose efflux permease
VLTLAGGFASTVSWPATYLLLQSFGWKGTYLFYAGLLALAAAPLHAFLLPRTRAEAELRPAEGVSPPPVRPARGAVFLLLLAAFASYAFIPSGLSAHLLAIFQRAGIDPGTAVIIGALFGPAQVAARLCEFIFARNVHPLMMVRFSIGLLVASFALLALFGFSTPVAAVFAVMFGVANGLVTIARGAVPLALFGPTGYGGIIGRIARAALIVTAVAPLVIAFVAERTSDPVALAVAAAFAVVSLTCFLLIRR